MTLTLAIEDRLAEEARIAAAAQGKSLDQLVTEYLEQLAMRRVEEDIAELKRLSDLSPGRSRGWRFNREEAHARP